MKLTITNALYSTNESFYISNDDYETLDWKSDKPKPTKEWCENKVKAMQAEVDSQEYARSRKTDYPDIGDQLDALYHAGVFPANMAARIKETKDKYPK